MSKYIIRTKREQYKISESAGTVTNAPSELDWAVTLPFGYVRQYCLKKGWTVEPVIERERPSSFTFKGAKYVLSWDSNRLLGITRIKDGEDEDITWQNLPEELKNLL